MAYSIAIGSLGIDAHMTLKIALAVVVLETDFLAKRVIKIGIEAILGAAATRTSTIPDSHVAGAAVETETEAAATMSAPRSIRLPGAIRRHPRAPFLALTTTRAVVCLVDTDQPGAVSDAGLKGRRT